MPTSAPILAGLDAGARTARPAPASVPRRLITPRDLAFLAYYYPVRWLIKIFGPRLLAWMRSCARPACRLLPARFLRNAEQRAIRILGLPPDQARELARRFMINRVDAALFDLLHEAGNSIFRPVHLVGRENLDLALSKHHGVILVSLHMLAKRESRLGLERQGIQLCPVIHGADRVYAAHGRLLWRFTRERLLPIQFTKLRSYILSRDQNATLDIVRILRQGGIVLMSPDVTSVPSVRPVRFLNMDSAFSTGALEIARLTGCPLVPMWVWCSDGECNIEFRPELPLSSSAADADKAQNLATLVQAMEEQMLAHPDQWEFWNRRR